MSAQRMGDIHTRLLEDVSTVSKSLTVTLAQGLRGLNSTIGMFWMVQGSVLKHDVSI